jgi:hypothetical protein
LLENVLAKDQQTKDQEKLEDKLWNSWGYPKTKFTDSRALVTSNSVRTLIRQQELHLDAEH